MKRIEHLSMAWKGVERRAAIFEYPIRDMQSRGWIAETDDTATLEAELRRFFGGWPEIPPISQGRRLMPAAGPQRSNKMTQPDINIAWDAEAEVFVSSIEFSNGFRILSQGETEAVARVALLSAVAMNFDARREDAEKELPPEVRDTPLDRLIREQGTKPVDDISVFAGAIPDEDMDEFVESLKTRDRDIEMLKAEVRVAKDQTVLAMKTATSATAEVSALKEIDEALD